MTPTNRTDEVARQIVEVYEYNLQFPKEDRFKDLENDIASAITSAVEQERGRVRLLAWNLVRNDKLDQALRQTPTQEGK